MNKNEIARDFLNELIKNLENEGEKHYFALDKKMHVFTRKEKTGYSILCPAIYKISNWFNMEQQIQRNGKTTGYVDFLLNYKDYIIAMENKTDHQSIKGRNIENDKGLFDEKNGKVKKVLEQINGLELGQYDFLQENSKGLIRIALLSIVFSSTSRNIKNDNDIEYKIKKIPQIINEKYNKDFSYQHYWKFKEELKYPKHHHKQPKKSGVYEGVLFLAYVE